MQVQHTAALPRIPAPRSQILTWCAWTGDEFGLAAPRPPGRFPRVLTTVADVVCVFADFADAAPPPFPLLPADF